jgi:hypothetical protein
LKGLSTALVRGAGDAADDDDDDEDAAAAEGVCTALLAVVAAASATAPAGTCMYTSALFLRREDACAAGDRVLPFSEQQNGDVRKKPISSYRGKMNVRHTRL